MAALLTLLWHNVVWGDRTKGRNPGQSASEGRGELITFSASGATIMSGAGVATVRKKIEAAFEQCRDARANVLANSAQKRIDIEGVELGISLDTAKPQPMPLPLLAERAEPIFRACERCLRHAVKRNSALHYISVPTENAEQLYADALRSLTPHADGSSNRDNGGSRVVFLVGPYLR